MKFKNFDLTDILLLLAFIIANTLAFIYWIAPGNDSLSIEVAVTSYVFLILYFLGKVVEKNYIRLAFSALTPVCIMALSVANKLESVELNIINPVNYFDVRILLMITIVIPFTTIDISKFRLLMMAAFPSFISLALFDPIHNAFGIGYYDIGLQSVDYYFSSNVFTMLTYIFIAVSFIQLKRINHRNQELLKIKSDRLYKFLDILVEFSRSENIAEGNVDASAVEILRKLCEVLKVSRSGIWYYHADIQKLESKMILERGQVHKDSIQLDCLQFPKYMHEILSQKLLMVSDAANSDILSELGEYIKINDIGAMMDSPFYRDGQIGGVICLEPQGGPRDWSPEETIFIKAASDFFTYTLVANKLRSQYQVIKDKNLEINATNDNLETLIRKRTFELTEKNKQLTEYAFINSHKLRAPIARVDGLLHLIELKHPNVIDEELMIPFKKSILELDHVSREINKSIEILEYDIESEKSSQEKSE